MDGKGHGSFSSYYSAEEHDRMREGMCSATAATETML